MKKHSHKSMLAVLLASTATFGVLARAEEATAPKPSPQPVEQPKPSYNLDAFFEEVRGVAQRYYPKATSVHEGNKITFESDVRTFMIHGSYMTGRWGEAQPERGPQPDGIYCEISIQPGIYQGQFGLPQYFNKYYFQDYLAVPYSKELDVYLALEIKMPDPEKLPAGFMKALNGVLDNFGKLVTKTPVEGAKKN